MKIITFWNRYKKNRMAVIGLVLLTIIFLTALLAPFISPYSPWRTRAGPILLPPSPGYPMGTDDLGRDILSQLMWGSRISLVVGFFAAGISAFIGIVIGSISGYYGKNLDKILMSLAEFILVIPNFVLALTMVALYGSSYLIIIFVIAFAGWPSTARLVRGEFLTQMERA